MPDVVKRKHNDAWRPLGESRGVALLREFAETWTSTMLAATAQMKRRVTEIGALARAKADQSLHPDDAAYEAAKAASEKAVRHAAAGSREVKLEELPEPIRSALRGRTKND